MTKTKKTLTKDKTLAKDRTRKRQKYEEIKNDPELYKIQKEKERLKYLKKKENKKICSIKDMSARAQREQRKRWKKNSQNYLNRKQKERELEKILIDNSPDNDAENAPVSPDPNKIKEHDPLALDKSDSTRQNNSQLRRKSKMTPSSSDRKFRYRAIKTIRNLHTEIDQVKKEKNLLQKKTKYLQVKLKQKLEDSIEKKVNSVIKNIQHGKVTEAKKKLLFDETLSRGLTIKYKKLNKKEKRNFAEDIVLPNKSTMTKHKILTKVPFAIRKTVAVEQKTRLDERKLQIKTFFEDDVNSRVAAGKNEFVKRGNIKKQKRYLNDTLKNLHAKYCKEQENVSYSVFCKYRPYWVVFPKDERDTCQCKLHANVNLLIKALKKSKRTLEGSSTDILNSLCCNPYDERCLGRSCIDCKEKTLAYSEFDNSEKINYFEWILEKQNYRGKDGEQKIKTVTTKKRICDEPKNIIKKLTNIMKTFFQHVRNIVMQHSAIKTLKQNLTETEVVIHVDFSENYCFKYHEEVQSYHFGGSRGQVSLHTVVMYYLDSEKRLSTKSICTMSQDVTHDASAVWAHIIPVLNTAKQLVPYLSKVHFLSDSPSSQYRNRFIFHMITKLHLQIPSITTVTWNYQEAGHGKGAPDGIGAVIKRTADNYVKFGGDVGCFEDFINLIREKVDGIEISIISEDDIHRKKFPAHVPPFKGTIKVHQVLWSSELPYSAALRCLSCFICLNTYLPCDHHKHMGMLNVGFGNTTEINASGLNEEMQAFGYEDSGSQFQNIEMDAGLNQQATITDVSYSNLSTESILASQSEVSPIQMLNLETDAGFNSELSLGNKQKDESLLDLDMDLVSFSDHIKSNRELDGSMLLNERISLEIAPSAKKEQKRPIILTNILLDSKSLQRTQLENNLKQKTGHQNDFERFLKSSEMFRLDNGLEIKNSQTSKTPEEGHPSIGGEIYSIGNKENYRLNTVLEMKHSQTSKTPEEGHPSIGGEIYSIGDNENYTLDTVLEMNNSQSSKTPEEGHPSIEGEIHSMDDKENYINLAGDPKYNLDDWVVVKYNILKNKSHPVYYIGKIMERSNTYEYKIGFLKKSQGKSLNFTWPQITDEDTVSESRIYGRLNEPRESRRGLLSFDNLPNFNFK